MAGNAKVRASRFPWWFWVVMAGLFAVLVAAIGWFLTSPAFEEIVRYRVVAELEKATGGTVALQSLNWNVSKLEIEAKGLTIHGTEPVTQVPLAHADRLYLRLRVVSFLKTQIDLRQLTLERPVIHVIVKPDGSTNVPEPKVRSTGDPLEQLFDLAIGRTELHNGLLILNNEKVPLDFKADDVGLMMDYQRLLRRYDASLHLGKIDAQFQNWRDIAASADAEFSLERNRAQVRSFKLTSQKSSVELSGTVEGFNHPKLQVAYEGTLDLAQAGSIVRVYQVRSGGATFSGSGTFSQESFSTSGKVGLRGVVYQDLSLSLRDASASSEFSLDREHILLRKIDARLLGGTVTGNAEVRHYAPAFETTGATIQSEPPANPGKPQPGMARKSVVSPVQQGTASFRVAGASLGEFVGILSSKSLPLDKLKAAGIVNGTVDLTWKDSMARTIAEMALEATVPAKPQTNQLPVSGAFRGRYDLHSGTTDIAQLNLATPHTEANARGVLGSRTAALQLGVTTTSLQEFQPLLN
ncbi:MAG TPA: hypothetical protein VF772_23755, partial [Terriglobales bacterium]